MKQKIRVWTGIKHFPIADYEIDIENNLNAIEIVGQVVQIPFGTKIKFGVVIQKIEESKFNLKTAQLIGFNFSKNYLKFIENSSVLTLYDIFQVLPPIIKYFGKPKSICEFNTGFYQSPNFNSEQQNAINVIQNNIDNNLNKVFLLWGVTGSGKTEVFFEIIYRILQKKQQILIILPEIAITESIGQRFLEKFGFAPTFWHSKAQNKTNFMNIYLGNISVVIGARCSVFLPFKNLGLVIVDEEHDTSYKQTTSPIYNCRDFAVLRGKIEQIPVILSSATPSLESFFHAKNKRYELIKIVTRYNQKPLPKVNIQLIEQNELCGKYALQRIEEELQNKKQIIFFLNRRGFGPIVVCKSCFNRLHCNKCQNMLNFHYFNKKLLCHKCNTSYEANRCLVCKEVGTLVSYGLGVEKFHNYLKVKFPQANIQIISSDTCDSGEKIKEFIKNMKEKQTDIAIGTQILAKGHDFPEISLVVICNINGSFLNVKSNETTFQTLVQVAGRAGRGQTQAEVILQTDKYLDSKLMDLFIDQDYDGFLQHELTERKRWNLFPFIRIIAIKTSNSKESNCINSLNIIKKNLQIVVQCNISQPIFIKYFQNKYFYTLIAKITREDFIKFNHQIKTTIGNQFIVDVDPINLGA